MGANVLKLSTSNLKPAVLVHKHDKIIKSKEKKIDENFFLLKDEWKKMYKQNCTEVEYGG